MFQCLLEGGGIFSSEPASTSDVIIRIAIFKHICFIETSTRLKSRDSCTPRRGSTWRGPEFHYSRRTPAGIAPRRQTADLPGMVCPLVLHDSLPVYGLSFRGVTDQRPVSCTCNRRSGFCPLWSDQHVFWETMVYGIFRQDLPFIRIQSMTDVTVRRPSSSWSVPPAPLQTTNSCRHFSLSGFSGVPMRDWRNAL